LRRIVEKLSRFCTVEIAAFDEFSGMIGKLEATTGYDHIIFAAAPTGHTLLLLDASEAYYRELQRQAQHAARVCDALAGATALSRDVADADRAAAADSGRPCACFGIIAFSLLETLGAVALVGVVLLSSDESRRLVPRLPRFALGRHATW
jgi:hypothetical protein